MTRRSSVETREHLLDVAHELFYWKGIRATGVDTIAAQAGVAPTVLYRSFVSKDALVAAYIERAEVRYRAWFDEAVVADGRSAAQRIDALFVALATMTRPEVCRGCPFQMALTEMPDEDHAAHRSAVRLKKWVRMRFRALAKEHADEHPLRTPSPAALADHLTLIFEGVYATVQAQGVSGPAKHARALVRSLLV